MAAFRRYHGADGLLALSVRWLIQAASRRATRPARANQGEDESILSRAMLPTNGEVTADGPMVQPITVGPSHGSSASSVAVTTRKAAS